MSATTAATAVLTEKRTKRTVFAHTVNEGKHDRPAASGEDSGREYVSVRSHNEQYNENPKIAVIRTAIHSFSSLIGAQSMYFLSAPFSKLYE